MTCPKRRSSGTSTCANTAEYPMPVSAWASSARLRGSAAWSTYGKQFRFPGCCIGCIHEEESGLHVIGSSDELGFVILTPARRKQDLPPFLLRRAGPPHVTAEIGSLSPGTAEAVPAQI